MHPSTLFDEPYVYLYKVRLDTRSTTIEIYKFYPEADTFRGPYCLAWEPATRRNYKAKVRSLERLGAVDFDSYMNPN
jgi:hypothetical protein